MLFQETWGFFSWDRQTGILKKNCSYLQQWLDTRVNLVLLFYYPLVGYLEPQNYHGIAGWMVASNICPSPNPQDLWLLPYMANDVIKLRILKGLSWVMWAGPRSNCMCTRKRWSFQTHSREGNVNPEMNRVWSAATIDQGMPGSHQKLEEARNRFSPEHTKGAWLCWQFDFSSPKTYCGLSVFRAVREYISVVLKPSFGNLLLKPQVTNTCGRQKSLQ